MASGAAPSASVVWSHASVCGCAVDGAHSAQPSRTFVGAVQAPVLGHFVACESCRAKAVVLASRLGIEVIAEGIESVDEHKWFLAHYV